MHWLILSLISSVLGVLASMTSKLALTPAPFIIDGAEWICEGGGNDLIGDRCFSVIRWLLSGVLIIIQLLLNAGMLNALVRGMHKGGTLLVSTTNQAIGFLLSGFVGALVFGEQVTVQWIIGIIMICTGVYLLRDANEQVQSEEIKKTRLQ